MADADIADTVETSSVRRSATARANHLRESAVRVVRGDRRVVFMGVGIVAILVVVGAGATIVGAPPTVDEYSPPTTYLEMLGGQQLVTARSPLNGDAAMRGYSFYRSS